MPINRPDRPLHSKGAEAKGRRVEHPDRAADLQERADGAHAEQDAGPASDPEFDTREQSTEDVDRAFEAARDDRNADASDAGDQDDMAAGTGTAGTGERARPDPAPPSGPSRSVSPVVVAVVALLLIVALIYLAMVVGVFTVG